MSSNKKNNTSKGVQEIIEINSKNKFSRANPQKFEFYRKQKKPENKKPANYYGTNISKEAVKKKRNELSKRYQFKYVTTSIVQEPYTNCMNLQMNDKEDLTNYLGAKLYCLNNTVQGLNSWNRVGIKNTNMYIQFKAGVRYYDSSEDAYSKLTTYNPADNTNFPVFQYFRIIIFADKQPNGTKITSIQDVFNQTDNQGNERSTCLSGINVSNKSRFYILRDGYHYMNVPSANVTSSPGSLTIDEFIKIPKKLAKSIFSNGSTLEDGKITPQTNGFYMLFMSSIAINATKAEAGDDVVPHLDVIGTILTAYREVDIVEKVKRG